MDTLAAQRTTPFLAMTAQVPGFPCPPFMMPVWGVEWSHRLALTKS